jgi:hypothetical protein
MTSSPGLPSVSSSPHTHPFRAKAKNDFLTEAEAAFAPPQPKKTAAKKARATTPIKAASKTAAKKTTAKNKLQPNPQRESANRAPALFPKEEIMFQFNYKLKVAERDGRGGNQGRILHLLLSLRPASGEAIAGRRSQGVSEKSHAVVSRTSATQQNKRTGAERSSVWKPTSLIRWVAFVWRG